MTEADVEALPDEVMRAAWKAAVFKARLLRAAGQLSSVYTMKQGLPHWAADELTGEHHKAWSRAWAAACRRFQELAKHEQ